MCNVINSDIFYHIVILSDIATCMHMIVSMKVYLYALVGYLLSVYPGEWVDQRNRQGG